MTDLWRQLQASLDELAAADLLRTPAVVQSACGPRLKLADREVVCLCSNDYLNLAGDAAVRAAAVDAIRQWGVGAGASRLLSGTSELHVELERQLAGFKGAEAAIVTSTGWMANHVAIGALAGRGDLVLCDKLDHASIINAVRCCGAQLRSYAHRDVKRLDALLGRLRGRFRRCLIVTDSLFSMDGDLAPLGELVGLKHKYDARLLVDEAHATGILGAEGKGLAELLGVEDGVDATVGTLSKAIGSLGGFVAGPGVLIETIRNAGRAFIYTTALPPAMCAAALAAFKIIRREPDRRDRLLQLADELRSLLRDAGFDTGDSASQIIPVLLGSARRAVQISRRMLEKGFFIPAIRPPTVPRGASRLRISLCAGHTMDELQCLVRSLRRAVDDCDAKVENST
ncbi:MAG: 8-amino-7-oxononanoate synthase [Planctomycetota bacterium]|nr:8-amino-7-oxononanoate synthase [Planctomycetota bacterium]